MQYITAIHLHELCEYLHYEYHRMDYSIFLTITGGWTDIFRADIFWEKELISRVKIHSALEILLFFDWYHLKIVWNFFLSLIWHEPSGNFSLGFVGNSENRFSVPLEKFVHSLLWLKWKSPMYNRFSLALNIWKAQTFDNWKSLFKIPGTTGSTIKIYKTVIYGLHTQFDIYIYIFFEDYRNT